MDGNKEKKCYKCKLDIPKQSKRCPYCNAELGTIPTGCGFLLIVLASIIIVAVISYLSF